MESLERQFCALSASTLKDLTEREVDVKHIRKHIMALPYKLKRDVSHMVGEHAPAIRKKLDMDRLFVYLDATIWNFIDYPLLEHIIRQFGSVQLRKEMERYMASLTLFFKETTVSQLIQYWPGRKETPPNYCVVTARINLDPDHCTLEQLDLLRKDLCGQFLPPLSEFALLLSNLSKSSVIVRWLIAIDLVPILMSEIQKAENSSFFMANSIENLWVRDIAVYTNPSLTTSESEVVESKGMLLQKFKGSQMEVHVSLHWSCLYSGSSPIRNAWGPKLEFSLST